eukprot:CAMPEP_0181184850 /NCGR_PEP_ID=MMETSP1096-20121128/9193_1 /TAXON_ID=156174 ORGANISM="Chrysochromulina ericina, Strain CCMP281" /NCGR_SAMPLE_ID=MMETSP1096 /ASSEMBLY_ACC=CAM_ASM_000453 /LENGTH=48 /DNA_ID= /DNA_START= /DNA_END= /DNA_ORIENTATION=
MGMGGAMVEAMTAAAAAAVAAAVRFAMEPREPPLPVAPAVGHHDAAHV